MHVPWGLDEEQELEMPRVRFYGGAVCKCNVFLDEEIKSSNFFRPMHCDSLASVLRKGKLKERDGTQTKIPPVKCTHERFVRSA